MSHKSCMQLSGKSLTTNIEMNKNYLIFNRLNIDTLKVCKNEQKDDFDCYED
jgi:hypothetical protein